MLISYDDFLISLCCVHSNLILSKFLRGTTTIEPCVLGPVDRVRSFQIVRIVVRGVALLLVSTNM